MPVNTVLKQLDNIFCVCIWWEMCWLLPAEIWMCWDLNRCVFELWLYQRWLKGKLTLMAFKGNIKITQRQEWPYYFCKKVCDGRPMVLYGGEMGMWAGDSMRGCLCLCVCVGGCSICGNASHIHHAVACAFSVFHYPHLNTQPWLQLTQSCLRANIWHLLNHAPIKP